MIVKKPLVLVAEVRIRRTTSSRVVPVALRKQKAVIDSISSDRQTARTGRPLSLADNLAIKATASLRKTEAPSLRRAPTRFFSIGQDSGTFPTQRAVSKAAPSSERASVVVCRISGSILHVAGDLACCSLGLVYLTFRLHVGFLVFLDLRFWNESPVANLRTRASRRLTRGDDPTKEAI